MFNPHIYKLFNNDLKNLNNNQLILHWKTIGNKENRIYNIHTFFNYYPNFNLNEYVQIYPEIKNYNDIIIMSHYHHNLNFKNNFININNNLNNPNNNLNNSNNSNNIINNSNNQNNSNNNLNNSNNNSNNPNNNLNNSNNNSNNQNNSNKINNSNK